MGSKTPAEKAAKKAKKAAKAAKLAAAGAATPPGGARVNGMASTEDGEGPPVPTRKQSALKGSLAERMMQGMGWQEGEGLGKHKQGITQHLRARKRVDNEGLGAEFSRDSGGNASFGATSAGFADALSGLAGKYGLPGDDESDQDDDSSEDAAPAPAAGGRRFQSKRGHHKKKDVRTVNKEDLRAILGGAAPAPRATAKRKAGEADEGARRARKEEKRRRKAAKKGKA
jgi:Pin2-interacting protein X1